MEPSEKQHTQTSEDMSTRREKGPDDPSPVDPQDRAHPSDVLLAITGRFSIRFVE
jgi:hypothetical protein